MKSGKCPQVMSLESVSIQLSKSVGFKLEEYVYLSSLAAPHLC